MNGAVSITVDGAVLSVEPGLPLGAVLHRLRDGVLRHTDRRGEPRGLFCGMGVCFDCLVTVDGRPGIRACITPTAAGMRVETGPQ